MPYNETPTKGRVMSLPKEILSLVTPQLLFLRQMDAEFIFMHSKFIEAYIATMKTGTITSFEDLVMKTIEEFERVAEDHPFLD